MFDVTSHSGTVSGIIVGRAVKLVMEQVKEEKIVLSATINLINILPW